MNSLHFEHESKHKKSNIIITVVAVIALLCTGIGCSYMMKQTGSDTIQQTITDAQSDQSITF